MLTVLCVTFTYIRGGADKEGNMTLVTSSSIGLIYIHEI